MRSSYMSRTFWIGDREEEYLLQAAQAVIFVVPNRLLPLEAVSFIGIVKRFVKIHVLMHLRILPNR